MYLINTLTLFSTIFFHISVGNSLLLHNKSNSNAIYMKIILSVERAKRYLPPSEFVNDQKYIQITKDGGYVFYHIDDVELQNPLYPEHSSTNGYAYIVNANFFKNSTAGIKRDKTVLSEEENYRPERIPVLIKVNFREENHKIYYLSWIYYSQVNDKIQWINFPLEQKSYTHINPVSENNGEVIGQIICSSINCQEPAEYNEQIALPAVLRELHKCHMLKTKIEPNHQTEIIRRDLNYWLRFPDKYKTMCHNKLEPGLLTDDKTQLHRKAIELRQNLLLGCNDDIEKVIENLILDQGKFSKFRFTENLMRSHCKLNTFNSSKVFIHFFMEILEELNISTYNISAARNASIFDAVGCVGSNSTKLLANIIFLSIRNLRTMNSCHSIGIINGLIDYMKFRIQSAEIITGPIRLFLSLNEPNCETENVDITNDIEESSEEDNSFTFTTITSVLLSKEVGLQNSNDERNQEPIAASILAHHQRQAPSAISTKQSSKGETVYGQNAQDFVKTCDIKVYGALLKILLGFQHILINPVKYAYGNMTNNSETPEAHAPPPIPVQKQPSAVTVLQIPIQDKYTILDFAVSNPNSPSIEKTKAKSFRLKKKLRKDNAKQNSVKQSMKSSSDSKSVSKVVLNLEEPKPHTPGKNIEFDQKVFNTWHDTEAHYENFKSINDHTVVELAKGNISHGSLTSDKFKHADINFDRDSLITESESYNNKRGKRNTGKVMVSSDSIVFNATLSNCFYEFWTILHQLIENDCGEIKSILKNFSSNYPAQFVQKSFEGDSSENQCNCTLIDDMPSGQTKSKLVLHLEDSLNYVKDQINNQCK